jgi:hypothetical protein
MIVWLVICRVDVWPSLGPVNTALAFAGSLSTESFLVCLPGLSSRLGLGVQRHQPTMRLVGLSIGLGLESRSVNTKRRMSE